MLKKQRRIHDSKYIEWIRHLPCIVCLKYYPEMNIENNISDPHHVNKIGFGTMGGKTDDTRTVPFCHKHHLEIHNEGRDTFCIKYNIDLEEAITSLNRIYKEKEEAYGLCRRSGKEC